MMRFLQRLGKSLMLPVACLPIGGILRGIGYWIDPAGWGANSMLALLLIKAGGILIDNMAILFALGVAIGMSKDQEGTSALAAIISWLTVQTMLGTAVVQLIIGADATVNPAFGKINNQFIGILCGLIAAWCYKQVPQDQHAGLPWLLCRPSFCSDHDRCCYSAHLHPAVLRMAGCLHLPGKRW